MPEKLPQVSVEKKLSTPTPEKAETKPTRFQAIAETWRQFNNPDWEHLPRLKDLSGLRPEQIDKLPPNSFSTRMLTAVLRAWQAHGRPNEIRRRPSEATTIEDRMKINSERDEEKLDDEKPVKYFCVSNNTTEIRVVKQGTGRILDEMTNPFNPTGESIYGTEYAQLVNMGARALQKKGTLSKYEVFKLTLLASIQGQPGIMGRETKLTDDRVQNARNIARGARYIDEIAKINKNPNLLLNLPLTPGRMQDKEFLKKIRLKHIFESERFEKAKNHFWKNATKNAW